MKNQEAQATGSASFTDSTKRPLRAIQEEFDLALAAVDHRYTDAADAVERAVASLDAHRVASARQRARLRQVLDDARSAFRISFDEFDAELVKVIAARGNEPKEAQSSSRPVEAA